MIDVSRDGQLALATTIVFDRHVAIIKAGKQAAVFQHHETMGVGVGVPDLQALVLLRDTPGIDQFTFPIQQHDAMHRFVEIE